MRAVYYTSSRTGKRYMYSRFEPSRRRQQIANKPCQTKSAALVSIAHQLKITYLIGTITHSLDFDRIFPLFLSQSDTVFTIPCLAAVWKDS